MIPLDEALGRQADELREDLALLEGAANPSRWSIS
jgi:hypothetical protein